MQQDLPQKTVSMTFYGYPDNCDSTGCYGNEVAENCKNPDGQSRNYKAGGDGSWNNPLSMVGNFKACSIVYLPYLRKYGIIDDTCEGCGKDQMDIWVESKCSDDYGAVCDCEYSLTPDDKQTVYYNINANQGSTLPVSKGPLYNGKTEKCLNKVYGVSTIGDIYTGRCIQFIAREE
ncbi:hypothetical protein NPX13_g8626 [Xylaria arbuscula]|uniref:Uncharacterized protein n=1 Tax=Xylaria arbuscula TaxID=114810 RepID=A0A9W8TJZ5_9PEZI|nr:hypothetical protein NPX13_g8626 [Xylaria arbuscula]